MRIKKKLLTCITIMCLCMLLSPLSVFASNTILFSEGTNTSNEVIIPRGNITGYKYKILNGKQWKRLWSYTYNKWMDAKWTLA